MHFLVADADDGFAWRELATLSEPGFTTDSWIGNACVTGSGERAVVAYAPRTFTNEADLAQRGAFTAVIELASGEVTKLPVQSSLAYFSPSCGAGERVVLTQEGTEDLGRTRLVTVDAKTADVGSEVAVEGQLTSPVPTGDGIVAADNGALVRVAENGRRRVLAPAKGIPFNVTADRDGGVVYMQREGDDRAQVRRATPPGKARAHARVTTIASGALTDVDVTAGKGGRVFVTGDTQRTRSRTPGSVSVVDVPAGARMSMNGTLAVTGTEETEHGRSTRNRTARR